MLNKNSLMLEVENLRNNGLSFNDIKDFLNQSYGLSYSREYYRKNYIKYKEQSGIYEDNTDAGDHTITRKSNGEITATVVINKNPANLSIDEITKAFDLDPKKWECISYTAKAWNSMAKGEDSKPNVLVNYSVKASFKPINKVSMTEEDLSWVFEFTKNIGPDRVKMKKTDEKKSDNVLVLPIFDAHLGKLAWGKETDKNYDIKIASERFRNAVYGIVERASKVGFSNIIFPIGNDFFQYDNPSSETTKGTRVDSDLRWKKLFKVGVGLLREALDLCRSYAPVDVILVQGNHDNTMSFYAFEALRGWYDHDDMVTIDEDIRTRTYRQVGVNLLGFTHGDKEKDNLYRIMQQEARELWGKTKYSEWIIGHFHKNYVDEKQGVIKRVVGSFSGTDAWHYESGYVGTLKTAQGLIYNKKQVGPYLIIYQDVE
jgi:predicted phosphodiesterase